MIQKNKSIILKIAIIWVLIYSLVSDANALTYNGGSTYELPNIIWTWWEIVLYENSINSSFFVQDSWLAYYQNFWNSIQYAWLWCFKYNSSTTSWYLWSIWRTNYYTDIHWLELYLSGASNSMNFIVYIKDELNWNTLSTWAIYVAKLPKNPTSPGLLNEWVVCFSPRFLESDGKLHIQYSDISYYNTSSGWYIYSRTHYWAWQWTVWLSLGTNTQQWVFTNSVYSKTWQTNATASYRVYDKYERECYSYSSCQKPVPNSDIYIRDFQVSTGYTEYVSWYTLPMWFNSTWSLTTFENNTWTSNTWSEYYANCTWFTDFWCYIEGFGNFIYWSISWFFDIFLPDISFTWSFDSCWTYNSNTGSIMQKFANVIAIINPIPIEDWLSVCTIWWSKTIEYSSLVPEETFFEKYIPWQMPELEISMYMYWEQTLWDLITIFVFITLIFYDRKHD